MAKPKSTKKHLKDALLQATVILPGAEKIKIMSASIKEGYCQYGYEITEGKSAGDTITRKGAGLVTDDMGAAFNKLAVHLGVIADVFKHKDISIGDIDDMHNHEVTSLCSIEGFRIKGGEGDEQVILIGTISTAVGWLEVKTSPVPIENMPSYEFAQQLKEVIIQCRNEVLLYKEGKYIAAEKEEDPKQLTIQDGINAAEGEE